MRKIIKFLRKFFNSKKVNNKIRKNFCRMFFIMFSFDEILTNSKSEIRTQIFPKIDDKLLKLAGTYLYKLS
jgi:hypothetical protein